MSTLDTVRPSAPPSRAAERSSNDNIKITKPEEFYENRNGLSKWITQIGH